MGDEIMSTKHATETVLITEMRTVQIAPKGGSQSIYALISDRMPDAPGIPKIAVSRVEIRPDGSWVLHPVDQWYGWADAMTGARADAQRRAEVHTFDTFAVTLTGKRRDDGPWPIVEVRYVATGATEWVPEDNVS